MSRPMSSPPQFFFWTVPLQNKERKYGRKKPENVKRKTTTNWTGKKKGRTQESARIYNSDSDWKEKHSVEAGVSPGDVRSKMATEK